MESTDEISNNTDNYELIPSRKIQFWTVLIIEIPSLVCIIYLLYHLLLDKRLRRGLHNHVIIILLILSFLVEVIDNPLYLDAYLHNGQSSFPSSPSICLLWLFIDYGVYGTITVLLAWGSFERHILIFYRQKFLRNKFQKFLFHYLPLGILLIYMTGFYIGIILFPPCENIFIYTEEACGMSPCYENIYWLNIWDYWIHGIVCILIEAICSLTLLIRIIWIKYRVRQRVRWRKHKKLALQLLSISILSLSITLPQSLITVVQQTVPNMDDFGAEIEPYFFYLTTFVVLFLPIVTLCCLPELWPKFLHYNRRRQRVIVPFIITNPGRQDGQTNST